MANAATIQVNSNSSTVANDGVCTLPEAVTALNTRTRSGTATGECVAGNGSSDLIQLMTSTRTYGLSSTLVINRSVHVVGYGTNVSIIRSTAMRVFEVADANTSEAGPVVRMSFLRIENGRSDSNIVTGIYFGGETGAPRLNLTNVLIRTEYNEVWPNTELKYARHPAARHVVEIRVRQHRPLRCPYARRPCAQSSNLWDRTLGEARFVTGRRSTS